MSPSRPTGASWSTRKDIDLIDIASPNDTHAEIAIAAAKAGKMVMCEKPLGRNAAEAQKMVEAVEKAGVAEHGLVQLPPRARRHAGQAAHRRRPARADLPLPREVPAGLDHLGRPAAGRRRACGGSMSKVAGSGVTGDLLAHCIDTAMWLNGRIDNVTAMTETFIKERKHNLTGKVEKVGIDDASAFLARFAQRLAGDLRGDALRPRPQGALHASRSTASTPRSAGTCTTCTACSISTTATKARLRGWRSIHVTDGDHPYMKQLVGAGPADRLRAHASSTRWPTSSKALATGKPAAPDFRDGAGHRLRHRRGAEIRHQRPVGKSAAGRVMDAARASSRQSASAARRADRQSGQ